jgi:hypothetical protein
LMSASVFTVDKTHMPRCWRQYAPLNVCKLLSHLTQLHLKRQYSSVTGGRRNLDPHVISHLTVYGLHLFQTPIGVSVPTHVSEFPYILHNTKASCLPPHSIILFKPNLTCKPDLLSLYF